MCDQKGLLFVTNRTLLLLRNQKNVLADMSAKACNPTKGHNWHNADKYYFLYNKNIFSPAKNLSFLGDGFPQKEKPNHKFTTFMIYFYR